MRSKCKSDEVIRLACIKLKIPKSGTAVSWAIFTLSWVTGIWFPEKRNYITFGSESHHYLVKRFPYDRQSQVWDLIALNVGFMSYLEIEFILTAVVESLTGLNSLLVIHDDVIKWKHFPRYWPFAQRPVTRSFDVLFDLRLNKRLSKQSWGWWSETLSRPLWRHCNVRAQTNKVSCEIHKHIYIYQLIHIYILHANKNTTDDRSSVILLWLINTHI